MLKRTLFSILVMAGFVATSAQSIKVTSARVVPQGTANLTVEYSGAPVGTNAWIGIYKAGKKPGNDTKSYKWAYTNAASGTATFDLGDYDAYSAYLFADGGYTVIAQSEYVMASNKYPDGSAFEMTTDKKVYEEGEPIVVTWKNAPAVSKDWIGIYNANGAPGVGDWKSTSYGYVTAADGTMTLNAEGAGNYNGPEDADPAGEYYVTYCLWDGYAEVFERAYYTVVKKGSLTISSDEDWNTFIADPSKYAAGTITLAADINASASFTGTFTGTFDGQGHTITLPNSLTSDFALFTNTGAGATLQNFKVAGDVQTTKYFSGVVNKVAGETTFKNIKVNADVVTSNILAAGFVINCEAKANFIGCSSTGTIVFNLSNKEANGSAFISKVNTGGSFKFENCEAGGSITVNNGWRAAAYVSSDYVNVGEATFINCVNNCNITQYNTSERVGGFVGSPQATRSYIFTNCYSTGIVKRYDNNTDKQLINSTNCMVLGCNQWSAWLYTTTNCYYTPSTEYEESQDARGFVLVDQEQLASGALCYKLNGDQTEINYRQNLGEDATPVFDATHKQVYASGRKHCNGDDYAGVTYNNESGETQQDEHDYQNGICDYCEELQLDANGIFHITNETSWKGFAKKISQGKLDINVQLDADLTVTEMLSSGYRGTFDGQGHTITLDLGASSGKYSIFNTIGAATIKNVIIEGQITGESCSAPICCYAGGDLTLENIISKVSVTQTTTNDGNCAGFIGAANANITFRNCIFAGKVNAKKDAGGFAGWGVGRTFTMENCAMIGDVTTDSGSKSVFLRVQANSNIYKVTNCYYAPCTPTVVCGNGSEMCNVPVKIAAEDIESGALCYALNGDQTKINFYQKINDDNKPTINSSRGQVYADGRKHCDGTDYAGVIYKNEAASLTRDEHDYKSGVCDYCGTLNIVDGWFDIVDNNAFYGFARYVNKGNVTTNARLTDDLIELTIDGSAAKPMVSNVGYYRGTFDGQGHKMDVAVDVTGEGGIFRYLGTATIKNLTVEGSITTTGNAGLAAQVADQVVFSKVVNKANVSGTGNVGGFFGNGPAGSTFTGTYTFTDCAQVGTVNYAGTANKNGVGGYVGWTSYGVFKATNCATIADITGSAQQRAYMFRTRSTTSYDITNCAYVPCDGVTYCNGNGSELAAAAKFETAADGAVAYYLNAGNTANPVWRQTIDVDATPTQSASSAVVEYVGAAGYASFYDADKDYELNGNAQAYIGKKNGQYVTLAKVNDIPAGTPVILKGTYYNRLATTAKANTEGNDLQAGATDVTATGSEYILGKVDDVVGFYKATGTIPAGKVYLVSSTPVKGFVFADDATGIELATEKGQQATQVYNLAGQRISKMQKGVNIVNGKKILF